MNKVKSNAINEKETQRKKAAGNIFELQTPHASVQVEISGNNT